jgi:hypothetical protein
LKARRDGMKLREMTGMENEDAMGVGEREPWMESWGVSETK